MLNSKKLSYSSSKNLVIQKLDLVIMILVKNLDILFHECKNGKKQLNPQLKILCNFKYICISKQLSILRIHWTICTTLLNIHLFQPAKYFLYLLHEENGDSLKSEITSPGFSFFQRLSELESVLHLQIIKLIQQKNSMTGSERT